MSAEKSTAEISPELLAEVAHDTAPATEFELRHGSYRAVITARGGALRQLLHDGRDLVVPFGPEGEIPSYRGVVCAPWPNRLADGKYSVNGEQLQLPINELERNTALHGLVFDQLWTLVEKTETSVSLAYALRPSPGYPFSIALLASYTLSADGLRATVTATNSGQGTAPYGVCPHPYLVAGSAPLDEWSAIIPAREFLEVTPDRLLPLDVVPLDGHRFDFRNEKLLHGIEIDHAFTGIIRDADGRAAVQVFDPSGTGVELSWGREWPWLQIHTADRPVVGPNRLGLAVEPMTCPPDAFNSGMDLVQLAPGDTHEASWTVRALQR
ncbi:aldose 1-epimerase family protein [Arthrobacter sp. ISL-30]|uniref:aldose 1-epimerase family protein n=1 Tax=Arthrobacter sp. ISL-30 TaxID=2819109 RepID=UPI001BEC4680|nr:aldose 1-epimerase family protein [Arthrobacter sp. ISL-30]MBT2514110.1 aldose 1-epimerase family protein [Arthrobacter sp. ISL-30]